MQLTCHLLRVRPWGPWQVPGCTGTGSGAPRQVGTALNVSLAGGHSAPSLTGAQGSPGVDWLPGRCPARDTANTGPRRADFPGAAGASGGDAATAVGVSITELREGSELFSSFFSRTSSFFPSPLASPLPSHPDLLCGSKGVTQSKPEGLDFNSPLKRQWMAHESGVSYLQKPSPPVSPKIKNKKPAPCGSVIQTP